MAEVVTAKYSCDVPLCASSCELTNPADAKDPKKALHARGWACKDVGGKPFLHVCPTHAMMRASDIWPAAAAHRGVELPKE